MKNVYRYFAYSPETGFDTYGQQTKQRKQRKSHCKRTVMLLTMAGMMRLLAFAGAR